MCAIDRLDRYWAEELGCITNDLYQGGVTVCTPSHWDDPRWMGWHIPLLGVRLDQAVPDTGVLSVTPDLLPALLLLLRKENANILPPPSMTIDAFAHRYIPNGCTRIDRILQCDASTFTPAPEVFPVCKLNEDDAQTHWYRLHFDGPVFVACDERRRVVAWSAIKCKSNEVWEMAVLTDAAFRNRGVGRSVVSYATCYTLENGRVPIYLHDTSNVASSHVCRALGYQPYGYQFSCECGRK